MICLQDDAIIENVKRQESNTPPEICKEIHTIRKSTERTCFPVITSSGCVFENTRLKNSRKNLLKKHQNFKIVRFLSKKNDCAASVHNFV